MVDIAAAAAAAVGDDDDDDDDDDDFTERLPEWSAFGCHGVGQEL